MSQGKERTSNVRSVLLSYSQSHYSQFKVFKNKGAVLVLILSLFVDITFHILSASNCLIGIRYDATIMLLAMSTLLYPLLGWLADVHFGRYKVIKWCLRTMWLVSIPLCLASALLNYLSLLSEYSKYLTIFHVPVAIGLGGFQTNIVQFGMDQIFDAPSREIALFVRCYCWLWFISRPFVVTLQTCLCDSSYFRLIPLLFHLLFLTTAVSLDLVFNSCLTKEPPSSNPLTLMFKVLQYAAKNKYPRLRSAFTYWDDKRFSRIDLGKSKYGGPFTTEEVENVKTFWRILGAITVGCIFLGMTFHVYPVLNEMLERTATKKNYESCFKAFSMNYFGMFLVSVLFPVSELILHPFLFRRFQMSFITNFFTGIAFFLLSIIGYASIEGVGHHLMIDTQHSNNISCPKDSHYSHQVLPINKAWIIFPNALIAASQFFFMTSAVEFLCAQSPYSMKGLLFGLAYGCAGLFTACAHALLLPVQFAIKRWSSPRYGCEVWFFLSILLFLSIITCICYLVQKWYKRRLRDNNLINEQMFAIHYYSQ